MGFTQHIFRVGIIAVAIAFIFVTPSSVSFNKIIEDWGFTMEEIFLDELGQTSSGLASGLATQDGRPLYWKSRDRGGNDDMEFHYVDQEGRIPFISVTDAGESENYYGGINAVGFSIGNTDGHNLGERRFHDDGMWMWIALGTCRTVDDFEALLDSSNETGRGYGYNYATFDAFGNVAMFEASNNSYTRYDAEESPYGFIIRANFSYTGDDPGENDPLFGLHRHDRSMELWKAAVEGGYLNAEFVIDVSCRDVTSRTLDPYPLPYNTYHDNLPFGCVPNAWSICRKTTRAVIVSHGVRPGERPDRATLWSMVGSPISSIALPLWVRAGSVPPAFDGNPRSQLCDRFKELRAWIYEKHPDAIDTWRLIHPSGEGLWDYEFALQDWIFRKTEQFLDSPDFSFDRLESFQNELTEQAADSIYNWRPGSAYLSDTPEMEIRDNNLILLWEPVDEDMFGRQVDPQGYVVYRSDQPFRRGTTGDSLAFVRDTQWGDEPVEGERGFYRVEVIY